MMRRAVDKAFRERVENYIDRLMPFATLVSWISALAIAFSSIPGFYKWTNIVIGFIFSFMYIFRKRISVSIKLDVTILIPFVMGILSFVHGGFNSAGITLILISNVLAVMLLPKKSSILTAFLTMIILLAAWLGIRLMDYMPDIENAIFIIQYVLLVIFLLILHVLVYTVRHHLDLSFEELKESLDTVNNLAYYDQLTGLENVNMFIKMIENDVADLGESGYLVMIKISNLRSMNTVYGDKAVDNLLVSLSNRMKDSTGLKDRVLRIDGSTFAVWYSDEYGFDINERICRVKENLSMEVTFGDAVLRPAYFIVSCCHEGGSHRDIYDKTRAALAYAMEKEIREPLFYEKSHERYLSDRQSLQEELYQALAEKAFYVAYQAKIDAVTGRTIGVEALARWISKSGSHISPGVFIPLIEDMNKSLTFTYQIIDKILADWASIEECYGQGVSVSINISPSVFMSPDLCQVLGNKTERAGVPNESIILELTEEVMINDLDKLVAIQKSLKDQGFRLSLDDFGSGYASFTYLVEMVFDEIKIDRSLVWSMNSDGIEAMVSSIINMTRGLHIDFVAEGVETVEQREKLQALGCRYMQGYLFARPEPLGLNSADRNQIGQGSTD